MADDTPIELDPSLDRGALFRGRTVSRIVMVLADGRSVRIDLPDPTDAADSGLSSGQRRIMRVLRMSPTPLSRKGIANAIGLANEKGRFATDVSELVSKGKIFECGNEYTDAASKFPD